MIRYKTTDNGHSWLARGVLRRFYESGMTVKAYGPAVELGYGLLVFQTLEEARDFTTAMGKCIFRVRCQRRHRMALPPMRLTEVYSHDLDDPDRIAHRPWPKGTEMYSQIDVLDEIPPTKEQGK